MHCAICGSRGEFKVAEKTAARDNFRCGNCRGMLRQRDAAQLIVDEFGDGTYLDLRTLATSGEMDDLNIYEVGMRGPIEARLKHLPNYVQSYFWDDVKPGDWNNDIQCQDLRALTYADNSFDLITSLEIFEHVFDAQKAMNEVARVLKPGGVHIFSMPVRYPLPAKSTVRARLVDGKVEHLVEPRYHVAGDLSKSLVVTDWGRDFKELHQKAGLKLNMIRRSAPGVGCVPNASFVARKIGQ